MASEADILITTPDCIELVVEAEVSLPNLEPTEAELKKYMVGMNCPLGLLITPERMWLYRDFYTSRTPHSVQRIGDFDLKSMWQEPPPSHWLQFEIFVQQWLELLAYQPTQDLPSDLRQVIQKYLLPAVRSGEGRTAHPRYA